MTDDSFAKRATQVGMQVATISRSEEWKSGREDEG
jgi:hypothetical protein